MLFGLSLYFTQQVAQERDQAIQERQTAEEVTTFLVDVFRGLDPTSAVKDTVTARELLRRGVVKLETARRQTGSKGQASQCVRC